MIDRIKKVWTKFGKLNKDIIIEENRNLWAVVKLYTNFNKLQQASAALTYHTLFAIVPVMALMVAVAKILGYGEIFKEQVQEFFHGQDIISNNLLNFADSYLNNTQVTFWLGAGIGLILLLYSVFSIFRTIDATFNALWNMPGRDFKKLLGIFAIVLLIPFVAIILLAIGWTVSSYFKGSIIHEVNIFIFSVGAYFISLFTAYKLIPQTKVEVKYATIAALVCSAVFALMQYFSYVILSIFNNYRTIYGDLASLIIFMVLIYSSWIICLAGSHWNYQQQRAKKLVRKKKFDTTSHNYKKFLTLIILDRAEQQATCNNCESFDLTTIIGLVNNVYDIPSHISEDFITSMIHRGIFVPEDKENIYHIAEEYRHKKIIDLIALIDKAGTNQKAIDDAKAHVHENAQLLWQYINGEIEMDKESWDIYLENFFSVTIKRNTPQEREKEENKRSIISNFFYKLKNIFK